jgi:hypothetical protein
MYLLHQIIKLFFISLVLSVYYCLLSLIEHSKTILESLLTLMVKPELGDDLNKDPK